MKIISAAGDKSRSGKKEKLTIKSFPCLEGELSEFKKAILSLERFTPARGADWSQTETWGERPRARDVVESLPSG